MEDVAEFIRSYTSESDEFRIRFDWNGGHAEQFEDRNMEFRNLVREAVMNDMADAPLDLIRDLYRAETKCSKEAWGIVNGVAMLAEALLRRGGSQYLDDYLEGKYQSFDASIGSAFQFDKTMAQEMLSEVRMRLRTSPDSSKAPLWRNGEELFARHAADCKPKPAESCAVSDASRKMRLRANVTFRCTLPVDLDAHPPGEDLAQVIAARMTAAGLATKVVDLYEDFAWWIESESDQRMPWALLGYIDDGPAQWLIQINSSVGWFGRLLGRSDEEGRRLFSRQLHAVLSADPAFTDVRWHHSEWSEPGWASTPDGESVS